MHYRLNYMKRKCLLKFPLRTLLTAIIVIGLGISARTQVFDLVKEGETLEIPFTYTQDFILVELKLYNKIPLQLIFDTGAENTVIFDKVFLDIFSVEYDMTIPIIGSDLLAGSSAKVARRIPFQINAANKTSLDVLVLENYTGELKTYLGTEVNGILGSSFFRHFIVEIDYKKKHIILSRDRETFNRKKRKYEAIPLEIYRNKPYVRAEVDVAEQHSDSVLLLIDTGAGIHFLLHSNTAPDIEIPDTTLVGHLGIGIGGLLTGYVGRTEKFQLGQQTFSDLLTNFQDVDSTMVAQHRILRNGILGNPFLSRYRVMIDYSNENLYLLPRKGATRSFRYDRSGLTLIASGPKLNQYFIQSVRPGSPAAEAGALPGDEIRWVQRWPKAFWSLEGLVELFKKKEGKKIRLTVNRNGEKVRLKFRLRKLI